MKRRKNNNKEKNVKSCYNHYDNFVVNKDDIVGNGTYASVRRACTDKTYKNCPWVAKIFTKDVETELFEHEVFQSKLAERNNFGPRVVSNYYCTHDETKHNSAVIGLEAYDGDIKNLPFDIGMFKKLYAKITAMHDIGILHLDLSTKNIVFRKIKDEYDFDIIDFGASFHMGKPVPDHLRMLDYLTLMWGYTCNNYNYNYIVTKDEPTRVSIMKYIWDKYKYKNKNMIYQSILYRYGEKLANFIKSYDLAYENAKNTEEFFTSFLYMYPPYGSKQQKDPFKTFQDNLKIDLNEAALSYNNINNPEDLKQKCPSMMYEDILYELTDERFEYYKTKEIIELLMVWTVESTEVDPRYLLPDSEIIRRTEKKRSKRTKKIQTIFRESNVMYKSDDCYTFYDEFYVKYEETIGSGAYGSVHKACEDAEKRDCPWIAKQFRAMGKSNLMFLHEVKLSEIASVCGFGPTLKEKYSCLRTNSTGKQTNSGMLVMDAYDGDITNLRFDLNLFRKLDEKIVAMHDAGILHLDLFGKNILYRQRSNRRWNDEYEFAITDFGLSIFLGKSVPHHLRILDYLTLCLGQYTEEDIKHTGRAWYNRLSMDRSNKLEIIRHVFSRFDRNIIHETLKYRHGSALAMGVKALDDSGGKTGTKFNSYMYAYPWTIHGQTFPVDEIRKKFQRRFIFDVEGIIEVLKQNQNMNKYPSYMYKSILQSLTDEMFKYYWDNYHLFIDLAAWMHDSEVNVEDNFSIRDLLEYELNENRKNFTFPNNP